MSKKVVVRYAPSPTGPQHIGGIRTALYSYLFAKKNEGEFILRIEDTDQKRFVAGAEEFIVEAMNWCGIEFTQGVHVGGPHAPYRQSERRDIYVAHVQQLIERGQAYLAFDTPDELQEMKDKLTASGIHSPQYNYITRRTMTNSLNLSKEEVQKRVDAGDPYVIRMKIQEKGEVSFQDRIRGKVNIQCSLIDDKILLKSDGFPTYHLANVVDDHLMGVTHVIRGEEWLPSTPLHVLMYKAFGWEQTMPEFAHLPLLFNPDNSKMSKRNADKFGIPIYPLDWHDTASGETWKGYRDLGYLPEAFINYMALLGWNPGTDLEIMSMKELISQFSLEKVHSSPAKFDIKKLEHFNQIYLKQKSTTELVGIYKSTLEKTEHPYPGDDIAAKIVQMMVERVSFPEEFVSKGGYFLQSPTEFDPKTVRKKWKPGNIDSLIALKERFISLNDWQSDKIELIFKEFIEEKELGMGNVMAVLRLSLTGVGGGPNLFEIAEIIGKKETINRIENALNQLQAVA